MKIFHLSSLVAMAGVVLIPVADAATKGARASSKRPVITQKKKTPKKPLKRRVSSVTDSPSSKDLYDAEKKQDLGAVGGQENSYDEFKSQLKKIAERNDSDICSALEVALSATGDEFGALAWMERAAKEEDPVALNYISEHWTRQAPANLLESAEAKQAAANLKKAADMKYEPAMRNYSICLSNGIGVRKDEAAASRLLMEACKSGSYDSRFAWLLLSHRLDSFKDRELPEVKSEIERGNHHIPYWLSAYAPDSSTQVQWLLDAAQKKNGAALYSLSRIFHKQQPKECFNMLTEAAKLHFPEAIFAVGYNLLEPTEDFKEAVGIQKDEKNGLMMIRLASLLGNNAATSVLANAYYTGRYGLSEDKQKAYQNYRRGYEIQRSVPCCASQGFMLLCGEGIAQDVQKGTSLLNLAARLNYPYACVLLAYAQYEGIGTKADAVKALEFLSDATIFEPPLTMAYIYMAYITSRGGVGLQPDVDGAKRYIRNAELDMGVKAQQAYDEIMQKGKWIPTP